MSKDIIMLKILLLVLSFLCSSNGSKFWQQLYQLALRGSLKAHSPCPQLIAAHF